MTQRTSRAFSSAPEVSSLWAECNTASLLALKIMTKGVTISCLFYQYVMDTEINNVQSFSTHFVVIDKFIALCNVRKQSHSSFI